MSLTLRLCLVEPLSKGTIYELAPLTSHYSPFHFHYFSSDPKTLKWRVSTTRNTMTFLAKKLSELLRQQLFPRNNAAYTKRVKKRKKSVEDTSAPADTVRFSAIYFTKEQPY